MGRPSFDRCRHSVAFMMGPALWRGRCCLYARCRVSGRARPGNTALLALRLSVARLFFMTAARLPPRLLSAPFPICPLDARRARDRARRWRPSFFFFIATPPRSLFLFGILRGLDTTAHVGAAEAAIFLSLRPAPCWRPFFFGNGSLSLGGARLRSDAVERRATVFSGRRYVDLWRRALIGERR